MLVALAVREKANCLGRKVGAIIVKENRIIGTGYNGTPEGMSNCDQDGCSRCKMKYHDKLKFNEDLYDKCICVHAEQNAMITAARFGHGIEGAIVYSTLQPCFTCTKEFLQAKIQTFYYLEKINNTDTKNRNVDNKDKEFMKQYEVLLRRFKKVPANLDMVELNKSISNMKRYITTLKIKY